MSHLTAGTAARLATNRAIEQLLAERASQQAAGHPQGVLSPQDREQIRLYSGYGGIDHESTVGIPQMTEYYTPPGLCRKMWALVHHYHPAPIRSLLDPAVGSGRFLENTPATVTRLDAYDVSPGAVAVTQALYGDLPALNVQLAPFESVFFDERRPVADKLISAARAGWGYDVVIGNPPYGTFQSLHAGLGERAATGANSWDEYFISRGVDLLNPGGILCFVVGGSVEAGSSLFLDREPRAAYHPKLHAKAQLLDAYRLPQNIFLDTDVSTEILVFRKRA